MEFLENLEYWHWLILGLALIVLEILLPSAIMLWPGIGALLTGGANFLAPSLPWTAFVLLWAFLSLLLTTGWQIYSKSRKKGEPKSTMNRRGEQYVGRHFTLGKDVVNGVGELNVDDTRWKVVSSKDFSAGIKVKVTAVEGTSLRVEEFIS